MVMGRQLRWVRPFSNHPLKWTAVQIKIPLDESSYDPVGSHRPTADYGFSEVSVFDGCFSEATGFAGASLQR